MNKRKKSNTIMSTTLYLFGFGGDPDINANALTVSEIDNTNHNRYGISSNTIIKNKFGASKYDH